MDRLLTDGPIVGRFFSLKKPLEKGASFISRAMTLAWCESTAENNVGLCIGDSPYNGDIENCTEELSYNDANTGVWRMWVREESKHVSKKVIETEASKISVQKHGMKLFDLPWVERNDALGEAKAILIERAIPNVRIVPIIAGENWFWFGKRTIDLSTQALLEDLFETVITRECMVWGPDSGWNALSLAVLHTYLRRESLHLSDDVQISDIDLKSAKKVHLKVGETDEGVFRATVKALLTVSPELEVAKLGFLVKYHGDRISVDIDSQGLVSGVPSRSSGGILAERLRRRFGDLIIASKRVGSVMADVFQERISDGS